MLLEEKKIMLPEDNDFVLSKADFVIEDVVSIQYNRDEHLSSMEQGGFGSRVFVPGLIKIDIDVSFYVSSGFNFINLTSSLSYFCFNLRLTDSYVNEQANQLNALNGRLFIMISSEVQTEHGSSSIVRVQGMEVSNKGVG